MSQEYAQIEWNKSVEALRKNRFGPLSDISEVYQVRWNITQELHNSYRKRGNCLCWLVIVFLIAAWQSRKCHLTSLFETYQKIFPKFRKKFVENRVSNVLTNYLSLRLNLFLVDGRWSGWSAWSPCSVTCGNGRQERTRRCDTPVPEYGGKFCEGPAKEYHNCEEDDCPGNFTVTALCWVRWGWFKIEKQVDLRAGVVMSFTRYYAGRFSGVEKNSVW